MAKNNNAWLIRLGDEAHTRRFSVTVDHGSSLLFIMSSQHVCSWDPEMEQLS